MAAGKPIRPPINLALFPTAPAAPPVPMPAPPPPLPAVWTPNSPIGKAFYPPVAPPAPVVPPPPAPPAPPPVPPTATQRGLMPALARYAPYARTAGRALAVPAAAYDAYQAITDPDMANRAMAVGGLGLAALAVPEVAAALGLGAIAPYAGAAGLGLNVAQIPAMREDIKQAGQNVYDFFTKAPPAPPRKKKVVQPKPRSRYSSGPEPTP